MLNTFLILLLLLNACLVGVAIYLSSYLKKKAENLATREEFRELEKQTAALTRITTKIETEVKAELWDRQKRWELKREVLFELARRVTAVFDILKNLENLLQTQIKNPSTPGDIWAQKTIEENEKWFKAMSALRESQLFVGITCGKKVVEAVDNYITLTTTIAAKVHKKDSQIFRSSASLLFELQDGIRNALREELGIDPQSSLSIH